MKNWKTTLCGLVSAILLYLAGMPDFLPFQQILQGASGLALAAMGYFAKDTNVTGTGQ